MPDTQQLTRYLVMRGVVALHDGVGRIPLFATASCAATYVARLSELIDGPPLFVLERSSQQIAELLVMHDLDPETDTYDFEATATGPDDALRWAKELAELVAARLNGPPADQP